MSDDQGKSTNTCTNFNASLHELKARLLNENLELGLNFNADVAMLLLNFQQCKVDITADVERAFLQVGLHEKDRDAL